ncbi:MAG: Jag N-terminal domain-containing protein [Acidobacteria bacterium]|nr:Jag N-terminal domain-containing protein [Acidobacteriota bacterium]
MEWVEVTAPTVEEAKNLALDQLGVDTEDAEFEVVEEPRSGLFGRTRGQARVRARIRPTRPRPKVERRDRRRSGGKKRSTERSETSSESGSESVSEAVTSAVEPAPEAAAVPTRSDRSGRRRGAAAPTSTTEQGAPMSDTASDVDLATHTAIVSEFLTGLVDAFGLDGTIEVESVDEETNEVRVQGTDLGILVGPKGNTLAAVQELSRTVVHRRVPGQAAGRIRLDVGGYRQRRREALERFTRSIAEEVLASGVQKALEPMNPADRKVVHDTVNEMDGVSTISEGEDARRRVVIIPA